jgi:iron complex outermembrane recepter protein
MTRTKFNLLGAVASTTLLLAATGAVAQTTPTTPVAPAATPDTAATPAPAPAVAATAAPKRAAETIVVTGSRIARTTFSSTSPITVITTEQATLKGFSDSATVLQQSSAAQGSTQINAFFTGFVVEGGPGVNTLSLRGLGPGRTLILFDGKRLPPSGVRGQVGAVDLNTLPSLVVNRYEVLRDGSSPIYGSEAIGGVVNVITRRNTNGLEVSGTVNQPVQGEALNYRLGALWGKTADKYSVQFAAEYNVTGELDREDRDYSKCVDDYVFNGATGAVADYIDPATGKPKCYNGGFNGAIAGSGTTPGTWLPDSTATATTVGFRPDSIRLGATTPVPFGASQGAIIGVPYCILPNGALLAQGNGVTPAAGAQNCTVILTRPGYRRAFTPLNGTVGLPVGAAISYSGKFYNDRDIISPAERFTAYFRGAYDLDILGGVTASLTGFYNIRTSQQQSGAQLFFNVAASNVYNPFGNLMQPVIQRPADGEQEVHTYQAVAQFDGQTGNGLGGIFKNGTWDISAQFGRGDGEYDGTTIRGDRVAATLATTIVGGVASCPAPTLSGGTCVPINFFDPRVVAGNYTPEEYEYLFGNGNVGKTLYDQTVVEGNYGGELFKLPSASEVVRASVGFHWRDYRINDVPGPENLRNNTLLSSSAAITKGKDQVIEVYGEVEMPLIAKKPMFEELVVSLAGRYTKYDSYPESNTYKASLSWLITPEVRVRGGVGTSYKAPALFELFLGDQTAFLAQGSIDPCLNWGDSNNETIRTRCGAAGIPFDYNAAGGSSATIFQFGGLGNLKDERAATANLGIIYQPQGIDLKIALDWSSVENTDQVAQFGAAAIVGACYAAPDPALAAEFCNYFLRAAPNAASRPNQILLVESEYRNLSTQNQEEIAINIDYRKDFAFGRVIVASETTVGLKSEYQIFPGGAFITTLGDIGEPQFTNNTSISFTKKDWLFQWDINAIGRASNAKDFGPNPIPVGFGNFYQQTGAPSILYKTYAETTIYHGISARYRSDAWTISGGVSNLFDEAPPAISTGVDNRLGRGALTSQYDLRGRAAYMSVTRRF